MMDKTCEIVNFNGKKYILVDKFEYKGKEYLYIIEDKSAEIEKLEKIENFNGTAEFNFLVKCDDGDYETIVDNELTEKLLAHVGLRKMQKKF